jgi:hypothetical protein
MSTLKKLRATNPIFVLLLIGFLVIYTLSQYNILRVYRQHATAFFQTVTAVLPPLSPHADANTANSITRADEDPKKLLNSGVLVQQPQRPEVTFLPPEVLTDKDIFAAAWWQTTERFLRSDKQLITNVEGDVYIPIKRAGGKRVLDVRMATDWLDFSVEHLSKWWKMTKSPGQTYLIGKLEEYGQQRAAMSRSTFMNTTLALIPYGVNKLKVTELVTQQVWKAALFATIASLLSQGVARIVVVGHYDLDASLTASIFDQLQHQSSYSKDITPVHDVTMAKSRIITPSGSFTASFGDTEMAYIHTDDVNSTATRINVPKGALVGLHDAMKATGDDSLKDKWLGKLQHNRFQYVYMTESDQVLHARLSGTFLNAMDQGGIIVPHRMQPIPHAADLENVPSLEECILPKDQFPPQRVVDLDSATSSCCDVNSHLFTSPTSPRKPSKCQFWWQCGLLGTNTGDRNFSHLNGYDFVRLTDGTGIVHLNSNEWSRRCQPGRNQRKCAPVAFPEAADASEK